MKPIEQISERVDTLIITVGTRQIGWRSQDNIIRSFGADGHQSYPSHVNELYQELGIERGCYHEGDRTYPWSVRDLGERYYHHCVEWLGRDFKQVELLLDCAIIEAAINRGLQHIILWATDQPTKISYNYRRLDTLWLAKLMEGKINQKWHEHRIKVDIHTPVIAANDDKAIRDELELLILRDLSNSFRKSKEKEFVLWIQNKGCAPAIASGVEICAAALVRQCQVFNISPQEPENLFEAQTNGYKSACSSQKYNLVPMGEHFWSLERERVISAWERGDFSEVQIWLTPHKHRYEILYKLAGHLALFTNWQVAQSRQLIGDWLKSNALAKIVERERIQTWQTQFQDTQQSQLREVCDLCWLIEVMLIRDNCTNAFIQFTQILERLLSIQYIGHINQPNFEELINSWCQLRKYNHQNKWCNLLHRIRKLRNDVIHKGEAITLTRLRSVWSNEGLFTVKVTQSPRENTELMLDVIREVCRNNKEYSDKGLMQALYNWGLNLLKSESAYY